MEICGNLYQNYTRKESYIEKTWNNLGEIIFIITFKLRPKQIVIQDKKNLVKAKLQA